MSLTELCAPLTIHSSAGPVVRPSHIAVLAQGDHRLDCKGHPSLALPYSLVLGIVRYVRRRMKGRVDAMADIGPDNTASLGLGVLLNHVAKLSNKGSWFNYLNSLVKTLSSSFYYADGIHVCLCLVTDVVCLVYITVISSVI